MDVRYNATVYPATILLFLCLLPIASAKSYDSYYYGSLDGGPGYQELKSLIKDNGIQSPDELLDEFGKSEAWSPHLEFFALLYKSSSAQREDVSPEYPRILSHYGKLVLAMTGKPKNKGGRHFDRIEILEFNPKQSSFHLRLIDFSKKGDDRFVDSPSNCRNCHGQVALRPIWRTYPLWPGVYGGNDDTLDSKKEPTESTLWSKFYNGNRLTPRYAHFKFGEELNFNKKKPRIALNGLTPYVPSMPLPHRASLRLSAHLGEMNQRRINREVRTSGQWDKYKFALVGAILDCESIERFLPEELRKKHGSEEKVRDKVLGAIGKNLTEKVELFIDLSGATGTLRPSLDLPRPGVRDESVLFYASHWGVLTKLAYLLEGNESSKVGVDSWGLDFDPLVRKTSYTIDTTTQHFSFDWKDVMKQVNDDDSFKNLTEDFPRIMPGLKSDQKEVCELLKGKSLTQ